MAVHEHECFVQTLGVEREAITCHNLLGGAPDARTLEETDLILIGGSGDFSVTDSKPFIHQFIDFLADVCVARSFPTFGSCFGFQGLVVAGGGTVVTDPARAEVGTFDIFVTDEGRSDPLLAPLAPHFKAQLGHKDRAERLPTGMTHLAYSERVPYQCIRIDGADVFATQFHPELSRQANTKRYLRYQAGYDKGGQQEDSVLASMSDSPGATSLLLNWVRKQRIATPTH